MTIEFELKKQLEFLNSDIVKTNAGGEELVFIEKENSGYAELKVDTNMYSIFIDNVDKIVIPFMQDESCADSILIQKNVDNQWILRVVEFKRTLDFEYLIKARKQIKNAIFKGLMLKGCLGIDDFSIIEGYCAFRNNNIENDKNKNPQILKDRYKVKAYNEWSKCEFKIIDINIKIPMHGIVLDLSTGRGEIEF